MRPKQFLISFDYQEYHLDSDTPLPKLYLRMMNGNNHADSYQYLEQIADIIKKKVPVLRTVKCDKFNIPALLMVLFSGKQNDYLIEELKIFSQFYIIDIPDFKIVDFKINKQGFDKFIDQISHIDVRSIKRLDRLDD